MIKRRILLALSLVLFTVSITGCGEKKQDEVVFQDNGVTLVDPSKLVEDMEDDSLPTYEDAPIRNDDRQYETVDKAQYEEYINSLPKDEDGNYAVGSFTPEQQAIYDKFVNGVFVTQFNKDDVLSDVLEFFSEDNLERIKSSKYTESITKIRGDYNNDKVNYCSMSYTATVYDNNAYKVIDGEGTYKGGPNSVTYQYYTVYNYVEDFYYTFKDEYANSFYLIDADNALKNPYAELYVLLNNSISNFEIKNIDSDIYVCTFDVDPDAFYNTSLAYRPFIEPAFDKNKGGTISGEVTVNYVTNQIDSFVFVQDLSETERNIITYTFEDYNKEDYRTHFEDCMDYEQALIMKLYIDEVRQANAANSHNVVMQENTDESTDGSTEENQEPELTEEEKQAKYEEEVENLWKDAEVVPEGTTPLLDSNGKRVRDTKGNLIFIYKDTFAPYNPEQIPKGYTKPIGEENPFMVTPPTETTETTATTEATTGN